MKTKQNEAAQLIDDDKCTELEQEVQKYNFGSDYNNKKSASLAHEKLAKLLPFYWLITVSVSEKKTNENFSN
jgi:hypothetical protein